MTSFAPFKIRPRYFIKFTSYSFFQKLLKIIKGIIKSIFGIIFLIFNIALICFLHCIFCWSNFFFSKVIRLSFFNYRDLSLSLKWPVFIFIAIMSKLLSKIFDSFSIWIESIMPQEIIFQIIIYENIWNTRTFKQIIIYQYLLPFLKFNGKGYQNVAAAFPSPTLPPKLLMFLPSFFFVLIF